MFPLTMYTVYAKDTCPFCMRVKALFEKEGVDYTWIDATTEPGARQREEAKNQYNHPTVPLILKDGNFIGGASELFALFEKNGSL